MSAATYTVYGSGQHLLFAFHGYGMDGRQFQVLKESLCRDYHIVGFHLPYHKDGPVDHEGWVASLVAAIQQVVREKNVEYFSLAGYSIGAKIALSILPHFDGQVQDVYLFAPYGLVNHWGISFLESPLGKGLFRWMAGSKWPRWIIGGMKAMRMVGADDHETLKGELGTREKRQNLRKTFVLMSELQLGRREMWKSLGVIQGKIQLVFGKHDAIFPLSGFKDRDRLDNLKVLQVEEGHWLMTEQLDETLAMAL